MIKISKDNFVVACIWAHVCFAAILCLAIPNSIGIPEKLGVSPESIPVYSWIANVDGALPFYPDFFLITWLSFPIWMAVYAFLHVKYSPDREVKNPGLVFIISIFIAACLALVRLDVNESHKLLSRLLIIAARHRYLGAVVFSVGMTAILFVLLPGFVIIPVGAIKRRIKVSSKPTEICADLKCGWYKGTYLCIFQNQAYRELIKSQVFPDGFIESYEVLGLAGRDSFLLKSAGGTYHLISVYFRHYNDIVDFHVSDDVAFVEDCTNDALLVKWFYIPKFMRENWFSYDSFAWVDLKTFVLLVNFWNHQSSVMVKMSSIIGKPEMDYAVRGEIIRMADLASKRLVSNDANLQYLNCVKNSFEEIILYIFPGLDEKVVSKMYNYACVQANL